jgi:DNA-binding LytR/AlgR family response regulator
MRTLIIEDEAPAFRRLQNLLNNLRPDFEIVDVLDSVSEAVKWLQNHRSPDLIFSDIQLSDGLSFDIYKSVRVQCPIVFTTAYDAYMLDAFRTNGIDYLLKPITTEDLARSIDKFLALRSTDAPATPPIDELLRAIAGKKRRYRERFLVKVGTKLLPIETTEVAYFYHHDGNTWLHLNNGRNYAIDPALDDLEAELDPERFFRLNRQFLCSLQSIGTIHQYFKGKLKVVLQPTPPADAIVSREKSRSFKNWMEGIEEGADNESDA